MSETPEKIILALETSGRRGGVAVLRGDALLTSAEIPAVARTAAALTPLIDEQVRQAGLTLPEITLVAVTAGPGSFTGLRVGVTTAKTLAYVLGCDVLGLNTLAVIAGQVPVEIENAWVVMDAQRQQLFAAKFHRAGQMVVSQPTVIVDNQAWLQSLASGDCVTGPGLSRLQSQLPRDVCVVDASHWQPQAEAAARLAKQLHDAGNRDDFWKLTPQYFRQSAAEEKFAK